MERITRFRAIAMLLAFALILGLFGARTYSVQMLGGGSIVADSDTYTTYYTVKASRGEILDRNGNVMVGNRASYDLVFNNFVLTNSDDPNGHLLRLVNMARELGVDYIENFPVTETRPYEYTLAEQTASWQGYFQDYLWDLGIDSDISASRLMEELRKRYKIPENWTDADARAVIGLRYELKLRTDITNLSSYVFLSDVPDDILNAILELNVPGLDAAASTTREYYTTYAAHILGTYAAMNAEDWEVYKEKGYKIYEDIIREVAQLFPSKKIHLGGDEAAVQQNWAKCPDCLALMEKMGYDKPSQLMIPFFEKILDIVRKNGKEPVLWCELDNIWPPAHDYLFPYPTDVTLVTWRNALTPKCIELTRKYGHKLIMAPGEHAYLDYPQYPGDLPEFNNWGMPVTTLKKTYELDPGYGLPEEEQAHIEGVMATLWAEAIKDINRLTYMTFPRGMAIAEAAWSNLEQRSWESFKERIYPNIMDMMKSGVSVRVPFEIVERK